MCGDSQRGSERWNSVLSWIIRIWWKPSAKSAARMRGPSGSRTRASTWSFWRRPFTGREPPEHFGRDSGTRTAPKAISIPPVILSIARTTGGEVSQRRATSVAKITAANPISAMENTPTVGFVRFVRAPRRYAAQSERGSSPVPCPGSGPHTTRAPSAPREERSARRRRARIPEGPGDAHTPTSWYAAYSIASSGPASTEGFPTSSSTMNRIIPALAFLSRCIVARRVFQRPSE